MRKDLVFVDTETTGLDPCKHKVFEIAIIEGDTLKEHHWLFWVPLACADPGALRVNKLYARLASLERTPGAEIALEVCRLTLNKTIVGCNPAFDIRFLDEFCRAHGYPPAWDYTPVCVKSLVGGNLGLEPPFRTSEIAKVIGVPLPEDAHTALADARWVRDVYNKLYAR